MSVVARVKVPLNFNPKDRSGADTQRVVYSDAERQSLVFAEQPDSIEAATAPGSAPSRTSLGAVPELPAAEPAAPKGGGAMKAAAKAPKKAAVATPAGAAGTGGDSNLGAVAKQFQLQVAVLKAPNSFAAYGQSYAMVEQQMGLIALEIQVRTAMYARCSHQFPAPYVTAVSPRAVAVRGCTQENMGKLQPNGMPKMISPAQMKTFNDCKARKEKMEADLGSGALTPAAYAKTLVRAHYPRERSRRCHTSSLPLTST